MKLWILSDLHIDQFQPWDDPLDLNEHPEHDAIVVAGDLSDGDYDVVPWLLSTFSDAERERLIYIPGNHDGHGRGLSSVRDRLRDMRERAGVITLNSQSVEIDGQRFVGCTMWSPLSETLDGRIAGIPDFTGAQWRGRHEREKAWLEENVQDGDIVVTHHAPSWEGLSAGMQHSLREMALASAYYADLEPFISERRPALWIHGHTHITGEYEIAGVPVASNARGRGYAPMFRPDFVVEVGRFDPAPKWP